MKTTAFLVRLGVCVGLSLVPAQELEHNLYSARFRFRGAKPMEDRSPVVIVKLDSPKGWGWDPVALDQALKQTLRQEPAAVLVPWFISDSEASVYPSESWGPRIRNPRVLWSGHLGNDGVLYQPPPQVRSRSSWGYNTLERDPDGVVRRFSLSSGDFPSLTYATARLLETDLNAIRIKLNEPLWINFMGPRGTVPTCDAATLGGPDAPAECESLKDRVVLLATDRDPSLFVNAFRTPAGEMSHAEILANEIVTALYGRRIYYVPWPAVILLILSMIIGAAMYIIYYPVVLSAIAVTGTGFLVVFVVFQILFEAFDIYVPSINIIFSLLVSYLVFTGYRLEVLENLQWRALKKAQFLRELDEMKSNFLSLLSHDIKTPVAKIQTVIRRLRKEETIPARQEAMESIENSAKELKNTIESILNLSRIEAQKIILDRKSNDINRIIQEALKRLLPMAQQKNITITTNLEPLFAVECDEELIRQVLTNLIDNAIKYSPNDSEIVIRSREEKTEVRVDVVDAGPGIPKDQLPLMFRKFSRLHRPIKGQPKGTGLGLYLSKYFINLHGGEIRFRTKEGKGTIFTFTLPLQQEASRSPSLTSPAAEQ